MNNIYRVSGILHLLNHYQIS